MAKLKAPSMRDGLPFKEWLKRMNEYLEKKKEIDFKKTCQKKCYFSGLCRFANPKNKKIEFCAVYEKGGDVN